MSIIQRKFGPFLFERADGIEYTLFWSYTIGRYIFEAMIGFDPRDFGLGFLVKARSDYLNISFFTLWFDFEISVVQEEGFL